MKYVQLETSNVELTEERLRLQGALEDVISASQGNFEWLITYASLQGFPDVKVGDFWSGSRQLTDQPTVSSAYTLEGMEFIEAFLDELSLAGIYSTSLASVKDSFMLSYQENYLKAWVWRSQILALNDNPKIINFSPCSIVSIPSAITDLLKVFAN